MKTGNDGLTGVQVHPALNELRIFEDEQDAQLRGSHDFSSCYPCPRNHLLKAINIIGGKWKALIICELSRKSMRYSEIIDTLCYVSNRILTYELHFLVEASVVTRSAAKEGPGAQHYSLTPRGQQMARIIKQLAAWSSTTADEGSSINV